jgi:hypothetical protein
MMFVTVAVTAIRSRCVSHNLGSDSKRPATAHVFLPGERHRFHPSYEIVDFALDEIVPEQRGTCYVSLCRNRDSEDHAQQPSHPRSKDEVRS